MVVSGETAVAVNSFGMYSIGDNVWNGPVILPNTNSFLHTSTWTVTVPETLTISGHFSGQGGLMIGEPIYEAPGFTTRLTASNSFSGRVTIQTATLSMQHPNALGSAAGETVVTADGTLKLDLPNGTVVANELLKFDATNPITNNPPRLLLATSISNTWAGPITTEVAGALVDVDHTFGNLSLPSVITGFGGLEKIGNGVLWLSGPNTNTYSGMTTVSDGYLYLNKPNGVPAVGNLTVNQAGEARWLANHQLAPFSTLRLEGGTAYLPGRDETVFQLAMDWGWLSTDSGVTKGTLLLLGDIDVTQDSGFIYSGNIHGRLCLSAGPHQIYSWNFGGPISDYLNITADICETNGMSTIFVNNVGLSLSGSNTFTGPLYLAPASVTVESTNALGSTAQPVIANGESSLILNLPYASQNGVSGKTLIVTNTALGAFRFGHTNDYYGGFETTNFWSGPILLDAPMSVYGATNVTLDLRGPVHSTSIWGEDFYNYMKGTLVISGPDDNSLPYLNTYDGKLSLKKAPGARAATTQIAANNYLGTTPEIHLNAPDQFGGVQLVYLDGAKLFLHDNPTRVKYLLAQNDFNYIYCGTNPASALIVSNSVSDTAAFYGEFNGSLVKQGSGTAHFDGLFQNGDIFVEQGVLNNTMVLGPQRTIVSAGATLKSTPPNFFNLGALSGSGTVHIAGPYNMVGGGLTPVINSTFTGTLIGTNTGANLFKTGPSVFTLAGPVSQVSTTLVYSGTMLVNTAMTNPVTVYSVGPGNFPTLGGTGIVGHVTASGPGARIAPGATANAQSYGKLTVASLNLGIGAALLAELGGTNVGVNMDQLESTGGVNLAGGSAIFTAFGAGVTSNRYAVVKSVSPVVGQFLNDPEGDYIFPAAGRAVVITYLTDSGKEITLIEQAGPPLSDFSITGITTLTNGHIKLTLDGNPGSIYHIEANTNLNTTNWISIGSAIGAWDGTVYFTDTNAPSFTQRFYRFRLE